jgi:hypothetical protein
MGDSIVRLAAFKFGRLEIKLRRIWSEEGGEGREMRVLEDERSVSSWEGMRLKRKRETCQSRPQRHLPTTLRPQDKAMPSSPPRNEWMLIVQLMSSSFPLSAILPDQR